MDFQKVGEVIFNNEKYNVLKATSHVVTDSFKNFMTEDARRRPSERIFIDDNGFRHYWTGLNIKRISLRKTDITESEVEKAKNTDILRNNAPNINGTVSITTIKHKPRRKKKATTLVTTKRPLRQANPVRTIAKTSFFCPFFGVITMSSYID